MLKIGTSISGRTLSLKHNEIKGDFVCLLSLHSNSPASLSLRTQQVSFRMVGAMVAPPRSLFCSETLLTPAVRSIISWRFTGVSSLPENYTWLKEKASPKVKSSSPGDSLHPLTTWFKSRGPTPLPQLGTSLNGHPSFRVPGRLAEAIAAKLQVSPLNFFCRMLVFSLSLSGIAQRTPQ